MKSAIILFVLLMTLSLQSFAVEKFKTQKEAQLHCPDDWTIWLNLNNNELVQFSRTTPNGAYVCLEEAQNEGFRARRNGQWFRLPQKKHHPKPQQNPNPNPNPK